MTQIAFLLYPDMTALDAVGPYEVLARLPGAEIRFVASAPGPIPTSTWTTSVRTGSLLLGAAGLLSGKRATTHWIRRDMLGQFGAQAVAERVVVEGKVISAAGVSAGIDMALCLAAAQAGEDEARALQLVFEYDPEPPFDSGSLEKADEQMRRRATEHMTGSDAQTEVAR